MKKIVIPTAVLLGLLLLGSTSLAVGPERLWWTEFTSDVLTWSAAGTWTVMFEEESTGKATFNTVQVDSGAPLYPGTVLIRPSNLQVRTDEPGLNCVDVDPLYVHPDQPVRFHIDWLADEPMSHQDAEDSFDTLSYTVFSDGELQYSVELVRKDAEDLFDNLGYSVLSDSVALYWVELERQGIHPYREGIDWNKAFCPWTVRP